jgi:hypothetical protein
MTLFQYTLLATRNCLVEMIQPPAMPTASDTTGQHRIMIVPATMRGMTSLRTGSAPSDRSAEI